MVMDMLVTKNLQDRRTDTQCQAHVNALWSLPEQQADREQSAACMNSPMTRLRGSAQPASERASPLQTQACGVCQPGPACLLARPPACLPACLLPQHCLATRPLTLYNCHSTATATQQHCQRNPLTTTHMTMPYNPVIPNMPMRMPSSTPDTCRHQ
jgi:hypothetical protein